METGFEHMSNEELQKFLQAGGQVQPTNAATGQPLPAAQAQGVAQYAAAGGLDPNAPAGSARQPKAQTDPGVYPEQGEFYYDPQGRVQQMPKSDLGRVALQGVDDRVRAFGRGMPILGAFADEANAATAAAIAPALEPVAAKLPPMIQALIGYDERKEIGDLPTFRERYSASKNMQRFEDDRFDKAHPKESLGWQIGGGVAGTVAALPLLAAGTTAAGAEAGLLLRGGAGALEGGAIGAAHGYGMGDGDWNDPSRLKSGGTGAMIGTATGAAAPIVSHVGGQAWRATGGRLVDAVRGQRQVQGGVSEEAERLLQALRADDPMTPPPPVDGLPTPPRSGDLGTPGPVDAPPATPGSGKAVRRHEGVDHPVEVLGERGYSPDGRPMIKVRGRDGAEGFVPEDEIVQPGAGAGAAPPPPAQPGTALAPRDSVEAALVSARREPVTARASEVDDAYVRIARALERQNMTAEEAAARAQGLGPFGTLADTGPATQDTLRAAINRPGKGSTIAKDNLTPRQQGVFNKETGEYDIRPSSLRITDKAAEGLELGDKQYGAELDAILKARKDASGPAYAKAEAAPPVAVSDLAAFAASPEFAAAYRGARAISQKEFVKVPGVDGETIMPLPEQIPSHLDWRTLNLMKQAMDDTISTAPQQGIGASSRGASKGYLQRFVDRLDEINPDFKVARDAFAGPSAMKDALEEGRKLLREDAYEMGKKLAGLSESERQMMRLGALQELRNKLGNANVTFDAANQAGLLKPNQLARFRELFPNRQAFGDFITTLENEKAMFGTNAAAFGNSTTAKQLLNVMEPSDPQLEGAGQAITGISTSNPLAIIQAIRRMGMESPMREGVAETIASVLTNHDKAALPEVIEQINRARRAAMLSDVIRGSMGPGAGNIGGRAAQPDQ